MRHPSTARKDGDLSRLTSSSASSNSTSRNGNGSFYLPGDCAELNAATVTQCFQSNYLPELIDPTHEWQTASRKRKDRQDSTSSTTQDRKLVRSNSEEYIPNVDYEVIRRVCSHEEFKRPLQDRTNNNHNGCAVATVYPPPYDSDKRVNNEVQEILKETHKRSELSPARSRAFDFSHKLRISPSRDGGPRNNLGIRNGDDADGENERRRNSERFCRARVQPGRKQSTKRPSKYLASRLRGGRDENVYVYKYDVNVVKGDRRGFVSTKARPNDDDENMAPSDVNNDNNAACPAQQQQQHPIIKSPKSLVKTTEDSRPWDMTYQDDTPVVCPRFADTTYAYVHHSEERSYDTDSMSRATSGTSSGNGNWKTLGHFMKVENLKTREIMQNNKSPAFATPDERLNQVNKRLISLKRRAASFEAAFENENGFRPSQADKQNDRFIKNVLAEIHKLRKEKQQLKSDPMTAMGFHVTNAVAVSKLAKVKETVMEIEKRLQDRRLEERRSSNIDELTTDQLMQEKTAVQKALIYFESLFGRPGTREERDAARDLYVRYRQLKRMVSRSVSQNFSSASGISELPTIMEHEAMQFPAPPPVQPPKEPPRGSATVAFANAPESPVSELSTTDSTDTTSSSVHENVHQLSVDELWHHLEMTREQKQELRRTIKDFEEVFEQQNGRRMLKTDRTMIEETYVLYKQKKAKLRLLEALVKKQMAK